jgi:hypothetical protein
MLPSIYLFANTTKIICNVLLKVTSLNHQIFNLRALPAGRAISNFNSICKKSHYLPHKTQFSLF